MFSKIILYKIYVNLGKLEHQLEYTYKSVSLKIREIENDVRFIKFEWPRDRKFILAKHRFEKHGFDAVCLIYHDFEKGMVSQLKLVYWVIVVGIDKKVDIDYDASIRQVKDYINSPEYGIRKRFYDVGERCYKGKYRGKILKLFLTFFSGS